MHRRFSGPCPRFPAAPGDNCSFDLHTFSSHCQWHMPAQTTPVGAGTLDPRGSSRPPYDTRAEDGTRWRSAALNSPAAVVRTWGGSSPAPTCTSRVDWTFSCKSLIRDCISHNLIAAPSPRRLPVSIDRPDTYLHRQKAMSRLKSSSRGAR